MSVRRERGVGVADVVGEARRDAAAAEREVRLISDATLREILKRPHDRQLDCVDDPKLSEADRQRLLTHLRRMLRTPRKARPSVSPAPKAPASWREVSARTWSLGLFEASSACCRRIGANAYVTHAARRAHCLAVRASYIFVGAALAYTGIESYRNAAFGAHVAEPVDIVWTEPSGPPRSERLRPKQRIMILVRHTQGEHVVLRRWGQGGYARATIRLATGSES